MRIKKLREIRGNSMYQMYKISLSSLAFVLLVIACAVAKNSNTTAKSSGENRLTFKYDWYRGARSK